MSVRAGLASLVVPLLVAGGLSATADAAVPSAVRTPSPTAGSYVAVTQSRVLDTRGGGGGPVPAHGVVAVPVAGVDGVPAAGVSAVALNVTVTGSQTRGFITAYPDGTVRPVASNLNFAAATVANGKGTVANLVIVAVGANGTVDLYNGSGGGTQLIADISGYYVSGVPTVPGGFGVTAPTRLLDTRGASGVVPHGWWRSP